MCIRDRAIVTANREKIRDLEKRIHTIFNPFNWFNAEQTQLRNDRGNRKSLVYHKTKLLESLKTKTTMLGKDAAKLNEEINRFDSFDLQGTNRLIEELSRGLNELQARLAFTRKRKADFDLVAAPIQREMDRLTEELAQLESVLEGAQHFRNRLAQSANKRDRALIHQSCEAHYGDGSPDRIIGKTQATIRRVRQDLEKSTARLQRISNSCSREISHIVIDGNNLCYESTHGRFSPQHFLGLSPILALLPELASISPVTVVFDNSITHLLRGDFFPLKRRIEEYAKVHVVPTRHVADDTVLDLAADHFTYVLSNDRYAEYQEKNAVREDRVIRHEIINGKVFIRDLLISATFAD